MWSFLHGLISLPRTRPNEEWTPNLLSVAIEGMLRGCIQPSAPNATGETLS